MSGMNRKEAEMETQPPHPQDTTVYPTGLDNKSSWHLKEPTPLLQRYANVMEQLDALSEARLDLEAEIIASMQRDAATEWVDGPHTAKLKYSSTYVQDKLGPVLELVPESDLVAASAYVPEHEETRTVEAKWNLTKLKPFAKRGKAIQDIIDSARIPGAPRLTVTTDDDSLLDTLEKSAKGAK